MTCQIRFSLCFRFSNPVSQIHRLLRPDRVSSIARPELTPTPDEAVFDKITMSAFEGTPLAIALRDCGIMSIAVAGIATEVGIEPTARHAADLCFIPVIIADACGAGALVMELRETAVLDTYEEGTSANEMFSRPRASCAIKVGATTSNTRIKTIDAGR